MVAAILKGLSRLFFRIEVIGKLNVPKPDAEGKNKLLIIANHESFLDGLLLGLFLPIRATFVVHTSVLNS